MNLELQYLLFTLGLIIVLAGAELFIRNTVKLASSIGRSTFFIGLTVAAFGTSAPELAIGIIGVLEHNAEIGIGNIVGSNIFNILIVLGLGALINPLIIKSKTIKRDIPILLGILILFYLLSIDTLFGITDAIILSVILIIYFYYTAKTSSERTALIPSELTTPEKNPKKNNSSVINILYTVLSIGLLALGSHWMVSSSTIIAGYFGISEFVIGLTIVAVGTSIPEIATTITAVRKKEFDLAIGNIIGSCILNIIVVPVFMTLSTWSALTISSHALSLDLPVMILTVIICLPFFFSGYRLSRFEGALFLGYYGIYLVLLNLKETIVPAKLEQWNIWTGILLTIIALTLSISIFQSIFEYKKSLNRGSSN